MLNISPKCQIYFSHMPTYAKYMTKIPYICSIYAHHVSNIQMYMSMISQILKWMLNNHECPPVKQSEWSSWSCSPRVGSHRAWPDRPRSCSPSTRRPDSPVQWPTCQSQLFGSSLTWIATCRFETDRESQGSGHRVLIHVRDPALSRCQGERYWPGQALRT